MASSLTAEDGVITNVGRRVSEVQWGGEQDIVDGAQEATEHEHKMGIWKAIKTYPKAVGWSVLASTALVMEGYDLVVIGSFYGFREWHTSNYHCTLTDILGSRVSEEIRRKAA